MEIIKIRPQGFCKGVINAIKSLNANLDKAKRPIYMYGSLVHNEHVISAYKDLGIIQIDDLDKVSEGTIIITAHGLSNYKRNIILSKNIDIKFGLNNEVYLNGEDVTKELGSKENNVGIIFDAMSKNDLFKTVILDGALPRKTFSMGHSNDKRFYLEARKIK